MPQAELPSSDDTQPPLSSSGWLRSARWAIVATWLGYAVLLFVLTHTPIPEPIATVTSNWDKLLHFGAYYVLTILTCCVCLAAAPHRYSSLLLFVVLASYGAFDEVLQGPFGRHPDLFDWFFNCFGIVSGLVTMAAVQWISRCCGITGRCSASGQSIVSSKFLIRWFWNSVDSNTQQPPSTQASLSHE